MTCVKVCGVTRPDDAALAARLGARAVGFILVPGTPRYVGDRLDVVRVSVRAAGPWTAAVAVVARLSDVLAYPTGLFTSVQYYEDDLGCGAPTALRRLRVLRVGRAPLADVDLTNDDAVVLDTLDNHRLGGTGKAFDWDAASHQTAVLDRPVVVAGGLAPSNVGAAIATLRPYGVDVSSGVESSPGIKDPTRLRAFMDAVAEADRVLHGVTMGGGVGP
jgi:phosphoribosylanthranilate isomerase